MKWLVAFAATLAIGIPLLRYAWLQYQERQWQIYLDTLTNNAAGVKINIEQGSTLLDISKALAAASVIDEAGKFTEAVEKLNLDRSLHAGQYLIEPGTSHALLIDKLATGDVLFEKFSIIEGNTFAGILAQISQTESLEHSLAGKSVEQAWKLISSESEYPAEGMLYPDTYLHSSGHSDLELLRNSHRKLLEFIDSAWEKRAPDLPLENSYEALILASIIEKETGVSDERKLVASVFVNRLNRRMRLQSDPTVIYGLGDAFDGNLTRAHLQDDTKYNTYTRAGLPPTPIAIASPASIEAALNPSESEYLYFVADGSGGHHFSKTLREHNNAVNRYQRKK